MAKRRADLEESNIECLWLEITPLKCKPFLLGTVYRNPAERADWLDQYEMLMDKAFTDKKELIILGDFNRDLLKSNQATADWMNSMTSLSFTQLINCPTRVTETTSTLIDHIYSSNEENISSARVARLGISDHFAILCCRKTNFSLKGTAHKSIKYRSFKSFDENAFLHDLSAVPWSNIESYGNVDNILDAWYSLSISVIDKHAPIKTHRIKNEIQPEWVTADILDKIRQRDNLKKEGKIDEYRIARNEVSTLIQDAKRSIYKTKIEEGKDDPKSIWKLFKEFGANNKKCAQNSSLQIKNSNEIISDDFELAEHFNDYFVNVAANLKEPIEESNFDILQMYIQQKIPENVIFELPAIEENFVFKYLSTLDTSKATGLDGIGPRLLKLSSGIITKSITYTVNKCITNGIFQVYGNKLRLTHFLKAETKMMLTTIARYQSYQHYRNLSKNSCKLI